MDENPTVAVTTEAVTTEAPKEDESPPGLAALLKYYEHLWGVPFFFVSRDCDALPTQPGVTVSTDRIPASSRREVTHDGIRYFTWPAYGGWTNSGVWVYLPKSVGPEKYDQALANLAHVFGDGTKLTLTDLVKETMGRDLREQLEIAADQKLSACHTEIRDLERKLRDLYYLNMAMSRGQDQLKNDQFVMTQVQNMLAAGVPGPRVGQYFTLQTPKLQIHRSDDEDDETSWEGGPYTINLNLDSIDDLQIEGPNCPGEDFIHPHINYNRVCLGSVRSELIRALAGFRIGDAFLLVRTFLESYNQEDCYTRFREDRDEDDDEDEDEEDEYDSCFDNLDSARNCVDCPRTECSHFDSGNIRCWDEQSWRDPTERHCIDRCEVSSDACPFRVRAEEACALTQARRCQSCDDVDCANPCKYHVEREDQEGLFRRCFELRGPLECIGNCKGFYDGDPELPCPHLATALKTCREKLWRTPSCAICPHRESCEKEKEKEENGNVSRSEAEPNGPEGSPASAGEGDRAVEVAGALAGSTANDAVEVDREIGVVGGSPGSAAGGADVPPGPAEEGDRTPETEVPGCESPPGDPDPAAADRT